MPEQPPPDEELGEAATISSNADVPMGMARLELSENVDEGRYLKRGLLGRGGMGEVRLCVDRRIGREVALKQVLPEDERSHHPRFVREALLQARLEHPAFVPVYDVTKSEDGRLCFTMRRVRGRTLENILTERATGAEKGFTQHRLLAALVQVCLAIDYAHSRGVIHRDLKPANIMLGDFGEVYVLDWGIAKVVGEDDDVDPARASIDDEAPVATRQGAILGTPGYMAPELVRGEHDSLDRRADVYALGAILYEVLTLTPLHRGSLVEIFDSTIERDPRPPSERAPERGVAASLDAVCVRAIAKDREDRFESARALGEAIEAFLDGDREAAERRKHARELAERAARTASEPGFQARIAAGRTAAAALAFDPTRADARSTLIDVLARPPADTPPEAYETAERNEREGARALLRLHGGTLLVVCSAVAGVLFVSETIDTPLLLAALISGVISVIGFLWGARDVVHRQTATTVAFAFLCLANGILARWIGPWNVIPIFMVVNVIVMCMVAQKPHRSIRFVMGLSVVIVPHLLEAVGVIRPSVEVTAREMVLVPHLVELTPLVPWMLTAISVFAVFGGLMLIRELDRIRLLERRSHVQRWVLRKVIGAPEGVAPVGDGTTDAIPTL